MIQRLHTDNLDPQELTVWEQVLREYNSDVSAFIICLHPEYKSPVGSFTHRVAQHLVQRLAHSRCSLNT